MGQENDPVLIYTTFENVDDAKALGQALVREKLAACTNILPGMTAIYEWDDALQEASEAVMIIKTRRGLADAALKRAKQLHPYDTPALLVLAPLQTDVDFAAWIAAQTQGG